MEVKKVELVSDILVGTERGVLKGINLRQNSFYNLTAPSRIDPICGISCMCPVPEDETEVLCGLLNRQVNLFDSLTLSCSSLFVAEGCEGNLNCLAASSSRIITGVESGSVVIWNKSGIEEHRFDASQLCKLRVNSDSQSEIATGGKENPLKVWDINSQCPAPIFTAKNVPPNWLQLRQPVWVTDIQFIPSSHRILTCTGYHQIRLYDVKCGQRRPVLEVVYGDRPFNCLALTHREHHVIGATVAGDMALFDMRGKGKMVHNFKGFAGAITGVACHPSLPLVATCSLDRFVRVHNVDTKELLHKIYVKSRATSLLLSETLSICQTSPMEEECVYGTVVKEEPLEELEEMDDVWQNMNRISDTIKCAKRSQPLKSRSSDLAVALNKTRQRKIDRHSKSMASGRRRLNARKQCDKE